MLYFGKIAVSEGTDFNKTGTSKKYYICHYWYLLDKGFTFQPDVCNGCHDLLMMSINLNDIATLSFQAVDYRCIINKLAKMKL